MSVTAPPVIGITADAEGDRFLLRRSYVQLVSAAGGIPLILPCRAEQVDAYVRLCQGFILSGGDDPDTTGWGVAPHPKARLIDPDRQAFELALLDAMGHRSDHPVLGICLGMQLMALHAGGELDQYLPDSTPTAAEHWGGRSHPVTGVFGGGEVFSHHRQAIAAPGSLRVAATAHDGLIEAVQDEARRFYVGVQWHPERTDCSALGPALFQRLVEAAGEVS